MSDQNLTGNKGEWSEIYVFFKLLADGELYAADSELNKLTDIFYPIIKIIRDEISGKWEYYRNSRIKIVNAETMKTIHEISVKDFKINASILFNNIIKSSKRTFSVKSIETFMKSIKCNAIKANPQEKRDITIVVHDLRTGFTPTLGFSIKSQLGGASTLLNASQSTNFIYKIEGINLTEQQIVEINNINTKSKIKDRIAKIEDLGGNFKFFSLHNETFKLNLQLIDSELPIIIGEMVLAYYKGEGNSLNNLLNYITEINPCKFNLSLFHPFYEYKIKNFLTDIALGLTPSNVWKGIYDATGGIIVVKEDGEVLCYHIYNRNEFQNYLIKNTKLETPSSSRHKFGSIYIDNSDQLFKLNLQIRFIK